MHSGAFHLGCIAVIIGDSKPERSRVCKDPAQPCSASWGADRSRPLLGRLSCLRGGRRPSGSGHSVNALLLRSRTCDKQFSRTHTPILVMELSPKLPMHNHPAHSHHCLQRLLPHTVGTDGHQNMPQEAEMTEKRIKLNYQRAVAPPAMPYMLRAGLLAAHQAHCRTSPASAGLLRSSRPDRAPVAGPCRSGQCW